MEEGPASTEHVRCGHAPLAPPSPAAHPDPRHENSHIAADRSRHMHGVRANVNVMPCAQHPHNRRTVRSRPRMPCADALSAEAC